MRVLIAALCDYANIAQPGNKLNVMGTFDSILALAFPTILPMATLALRLTFDYEDRESKHQLSVTIVNQDGKEFAKIEGELQIPPIPPGRRETANQIIVLQQLTFQRPDKFKIVIGWDGQEIQRLQLDVDLLPQAPSPPAPPGA